jgi:hypothetical protein
MSTATSDSPFRSDLPSASAAVIADARRRQNRRRLMTAAACTVVIAAYFGGGHPGIGGSRSGTRQSAPKHVAAPPTGAIAQSGPLEILVPKGWWTAGGSRTTNVAGRGRRVAIVITADFPLYPLHPPLRLDAPPRPAANRFLISLTHFHATGPARDWPNVKTIQLPSKVGTSMVLRARVDSEAVLTRVRFGSTPTNQQLALVNAFLANVRNNRDE